MTEAPFECLRNRLIETINGYRERWHTWSSNHLTAQLTAQGIIIAICALSEAKNRWAACIELAITLISIFAIVFVVIICQCRIKQFAGLGLEAGQLPRDWNEYDAWRTSMDTKVQGLATFANSVRWMENWIDVCLLLNLCLVLVLMLLKTLPTILAAPKACS